MNAILNFFEGIGNVILAVIEFVVSFFGDLVWIVRTALWAVGQIPSLISWIPGPIMSVMLVIFSVVVIYKIMGREG